MERSGKHCELCGKGAMERHLVSHAKNNFVRRAHANLRRMRVQDGAKVKVIWICAKCLKKGRAVPALPRKLSRPPAAAAPAH